MLSKLALFDVPFQLVILKIIALLKPMSVLFFFRCSIEQFEAAN